MNTRKSLGLLCAAIALLMLGGCSHPQAQSSASSRLLGAWYDNKSGDEYKFISSSMLAVPHPQPGSGNVVPYRILDGDKLDIVSSGSHHVSIIQSITADRLTLADPLSNAPQYFYRNMARTEHIKSVEASALAAASHFATTGVYPSIVWVAPKPTGKGSEWADWSPTSLTTYNTAWDWSTLKRDKTLALTFGAGPTMGYAFSFTRKVPTPQQLAAVYKNTSIEATAGLPHIDVGYSAAKAQYPAGTLVYLPGGLICSLGDGFAIGVALDRKAESFVPLTHN